VSSTIARVRALMFATVTLSLALLPFVDWTLTTALTAAAMYFVYDCLGVVVGNHRYWSHKSFEFRHPALRYASVLAALLSGTGSTLGWAGLHRLHHKHSDTPSDPHQQSRGLWKTLFIFYQADDKQILRNCMDNARDPFLRLTDRYWLPIMAVWIALLAAIGLDALYFVFILPSALTMIAQGMTNYMCHGRHGYAPHASADAVNCPWIAPFNWGEAWHNNHHANPKSPSTRERWWEFDVAGALIKALAKN